jgi:glycosyltransferase involved in cell wall biosynthesis
MSFLDRVSALVLTYNEAPNIGRTLAALSRLPEVVVLDSNSTDGTAAIVASFSNARLVRRAFDTHADQWNYGLANCGIRREWVLALDADYIVPPDLLDEIAALEPAASLAAYRASFNYCVHGKRLSGSLYPPVTVLFRRGRARFAQTGHTQRIAVEGDVADLEQRIDHDDRKPLSRWLASQQRYVRLEADYLLTTPRSALGWTGRMRLMIWPAPILVFFYTLLAKGLVFGGWRGWFYALQRLLAESMIAIELLDRRLRGATGADRAGLRLYRSQTQSPLDET